MHRAQPWAPLEGGTFYGAGIGSPTLFPVVDEGWYVNMYWTSAARPPRGTRMIFRTPGSDARGGGVRGLRDGPGRPLVRRRHARGDALLPGHRARQRAAPWASRRISRCRSARACALPDAPGADGRTGAGRRLRLLREGRLPGPALHRRRGRGAAALRLGVPLPGRLRPRPLHLDLPRRPPHGGVLPRAGPGGRRVEALVRQRPTPRSGPSRSSEDRAALGRAWAARRGLRRRHRHPPTLGRDGRAALGHHGPGHEGLHAERRARVLVEPAHGGEVEDLRPHHLRARGDDRPPRGAGVAQLGDIWVQWLDHAQPEIAEPIAEFFYSLGRGDYDVNSAIAYLDQMSLKIMEEQPLTVRIVSATDVGQQREHNEDACYPDIKRQKRTEQADSLRDRLAIVCDGLGGHEGGEVASSLAIKTLEQQLKTLLHQAENDPDFSAQGFIAQLEMVTRVVNNQIVDNVSGNIMLNNTSEPTLVIVMPTAAAA